MLNQNVQIYIGDLKFNADSHLFIDSDNYHSIYVSSFDSRIPFLDIDYLGVTRHEIGRIVSEVKRKVVLTTLYPEKIDTKWECQINYKDDWIKRDDPKIYEVVKEIFHDKDRSRVRKSLIDNNISLFMINKVVYICVKSCASNMSNVCVNNHVTFFTFVQFVYI